MTRRADGVCVWPRRQSVLLLHDASLAQHGGLRGLRDEGLLESALARPQQLLNYKEDSTLAELAAAYAVGLTRNHPFVDGNKRTALLLVGLFLELNGYTLEVAQPEAVLKMYAIASGELDEPGLSAWVAENLVEL